MKPSIIVAPLLGMSLLVGCVSVPTGPSVMALPGTGKSFDQFRADDMECRNYAHFQTGGTTANQAANDAGVKSAVVGTAIGAAAGAAIGGREGAGVGAGSGLLMGSMIGAGAAETSARGTQQQYDNAYIQCMYAKGEKVPLPGAISRSMSEKPSPPPQPTPSRKSPPPPPPPPPGY